MKKIFTFFSALAVGMAGFGQTIFQSDLSSWAAGDPTDWMGSKTTILSANVVEQTVGVTYGTSMASLINTGTTTGDHKRFTTQPVAVTAGETYLIEMWVGGMMGMLRTGFYDATNNAFNPYNSYFDLSVESGGSLVLLTQEVTVPAGCTSGEFILSVYGTDPATAGSPFFLGVVVDSVAISVTTPTPPTVVSIYDIQYTTASPADSPELGNVVTTKGVVTGVFQIGSDVDRFFIQDGDGAWNGIYVYDNAHTVAIGDSVLVTGTVQEYFGLTEIGFVTAVTILNSGNTLPAPSVVTNATVGNEEYEGVLVQVQDATCTVVTDSFGEWQINDGTGADLIVDDNLMPALYTSALGNVYDVIGVRHYAFGENVLLPRTEADDINVVGVAGIGENQSLSIYPNPASGILFINVQPGAVVSIYNMAGALVFNGMVDQSIDISALEPGVYQVSVSANESVSTSRLVVE